jgi:hypothetical protein
MYLNANIKENKLVIYLPTYLLVSLTHSLRVFLLSPLVYFPYSIIGNSTGIEIRFLSLIFGWFPGFILILGTYFRTYTLHNLFLDACKLSCLIFGLVILLFFLFSLVLTTVLRDNHDWLHFSFTKGMATTFGRILLNRNLCPFYLATSCCIDKHNHFL